jgi:hypothetical protein
MGCKLIVAPHKYGWAVSAHSHIITVGVSIAGFVNLVLLKPHVELNVSN